MTNHAQMSKKKFNGSFGTWLKQRRKALDMTQQEVAILVACSVVTVRKIEGDIARPSRQIAERLADPHRLWIRRGRFRAQY